MRRRLRVRVSAARLHDSIASLLHLPRGARIRGLKRHNEGLYYTVFGFALEGVGSTDGGYAARILNPEERDDEALARMVRSAKLLEHLPEGLSPRTVAFDETGGHLGLPFAIETWVSGMPLSMAPKDPERYAPIAARWLAQVHAVPLNEPIRALLPPRLPRAELDEAIKDVEGLSADVPPALHAALDVAARLMPQEPGEILLHGDPLLQNLVLRFGERVQEELCTWIDWEFARIGDRAYDLAIFTRGRLKGAVRKGYFDAYRQASGVTVPESHVLFHELLMRVHWVCEVLRACLPFRVQEELNALEKLLRRTGAV